MERIILHSDFNNFYANVECLKNPSLQGRPVAVVGDPATRHGIVLSKNEMAKHKGVCTGEALWQAKQKCPDILFIPAHFDQYVQYSQAAKEIYMSFTDLVEPFGLDECWLDVTNTRHLFGDGKTIADTLRQTVRCKLGLTVSVGVSFNKVFAKLGSDLRKPDATTVLNVNDIREAVWPLPVSRLLSVGPATTRKLQSYGIHTIGDLAHANPVLLKSILGKNGTKLWHFANGRDLSTVSPFLPPAKSVGHSVTSPRDLCTDEDVKLTLVGLCERVAARLRKQRCVCSVVQLGIRDNTLFSYERQEKLKIPSNHWKDLFDTAFALYKTHHAEGVPIRSLSVRALSLSITTECNQISLFPQEMQTMKRRDLDATIDSLRERYGFNAIRPGIILTDPALDWNGQTGFSPFCASNDEMK